MAKIINTTELKKQKRRLSKPVIIAVAAVVAVTAIGLYFVFGKSDAERSQDQFESNSQNTGTRYEGPALKADNPLKPLDVDYDQLNEQELMNRVAILSATEQYDEAEKLIKTQNDYTSSTTKLFMLAYVQLDLKKNEAVAATAVAIEKMPDLEPGQFRSLGQLHSSIGQKQKAIGILKRAAEGYEALKIGNSGAEAERIRKDIQELEQS